MNRPRKSRPALRRTSHRAVEAFKAEHGRDPSESDTLPSVAPASDEDRDAWKAEYIANAIKALAEGTVGLIVRGPSVDPVDARMEKIAKAEVLNVKGAGIKVPKEGRAVTSDGTKKTLDDMIETRLERFGDRIGLKPKRHQGRSQARKRRGWKRQAPSPKPPMRWACKPGRLVNDWGTFAPLSFGWTRIWSRIDS